MVRVLNFVCVALMGLSILALYHVSERTRVVRMELSRTDSDIAKQRAAMAVLETEWQHVTTPDRIQQLAQARLGMDDGTSVQLSSFDQLPRRGADAPLNGSPVRNANALAPAQAAAQPADPSGM
jgi:hypothetical protein